MTLIQPCAENAIHRKGHQPFERTIGDLLNFQAKEDVHTAFIRDELEQMKLGKSPRNVFRET